MLPMLVAAATTFIALLFIHAAWHKIADFSSFTGFVADYRLLPQQLVAPAAWLLVASEVLAVLLVVVPPLSTIGAALALLLLLTYAIAIGVNVARGHVRIECGCGGPAQQLSVLLLVRNGVLAVVAALALVLPARSLGLPETLAAMGAGLTTWALYVILEQIIANAGQIESQLPQGTERR